MMTRAVTRSADLPAARDRLFDTVRRWAHSCVARYESQPPTDGHDQATYATAWAPYIAATRDAKLIGFLKALRDRIRSHFTDTGKWYHGYWREQEVHHGTEHFELFLGTLYRLDPTDRETRRELVDAAEHIGNWVEGIPRWFNHSSGLFESLYLGTEIVSTETGCDLNVPDHFRLVNLCLLASEITGHRRYLVLAEQHASLWAEAIAKLPQLPVGLTQDGALTSVAPSLAAPYRRFAGMVGHLEDDVDRAENLLASNATGSFRTLWQVTGHAPYRHALERVLDVLATQLVDPDAGAAAAEIAAYNRASGSKRYHDAVVAAHSQLLDRRDPLAIKEVGIEATVARSQRPHGIGKRTDMPRWLENGEPRVHNPIALALAAEVLKDEALAICAVDVAQAYLALARDTLEDGRHHGCAANTVSAVARGHGRDNHWGVVSGIALFEPFAWAT